MTPRERWIALLSGERPDRLPTDYWATPEVHARLKAALGCADDESLWNRLGIDRVRHVGPRPPSPPGPVDGMRRDIWGVGYRDIDYGAGAYGEAALHPLAGDIAVRDVEAHPWPSPDDFDYSGIPAQLDANAGRRFVQAGGYEPFLTYCALRGMEQAYEDLLLNPSIADAVLGWLFAIHHEVNRRTWEAGRGRIDAMYLAEDLGGQTGPLFSLDVYRRFLLPGQRAMAALARSYGVRVFYHTDGAARAFLPDLIDVVGIDVLNPIQWRCPGMDVVGLARDFGERVVFHGAVDNQQTMPFGTPGEVRAQVHDLARQFRGARWICAPCHNLQPVTPIENIVALYEAAAEVAP